MAAIRQCGCYIQFGGMVLVYLIQTFQNLLPLNPEKLEGVTPWHLAFNTAVSFMTNTNWQAYGGESTMSYFTQMTALTVQNFLSAATGLAVAVAFIRGLIRRATDRIGNFWADMVAASFGFCCRLSIVFSLLLIQQGALQNLSSYASVQTLEGAGQTIAMGPVASQEAIKMLGVNGGGFFKRQFGSSLRKPNSSNQFPANGEYFPDSNGSCLRFWADGSGSATGVCGSGSDADFVRAERRRHIRGGNVRQPIA